ncbi:hypothetical protein [Bacteroides nordii]|nr:hypothetical protein [Bacteroides nordii]
MNVTVLIIERAYRKRFEIIVRNKLYAALKYGLSLRIIVSLGEQ